MSFLFLWKSDSPALFVTHFWITFNLPTVCWMNKWNEWMISGHKMAACWIWKRFCPQSIYLKKTKKQNKNNKWTNILPSSFTKNQISNVALIMRKTNKTRYLGWMRQGKCDLPQFLTSLLHLFMLATCRKGISVFDSRIISSIIIAHFWAPTTLFPRK